MILKIKKIFCVVGTRPEAIKMAPLILALKKEQWVNLRVVVTAQHRHMLDQINNFFDITPDIDLNLMQVNQTLAGLTSKILVQFHNALINETPDLVLVQGDTTTVMAAALACFYCHIPIGHIEAGLRTGDLKNPFPEEVNRVIASKLASWHFAPTEGSKQNLLKEGIQNEKIVVTGNTVIDALLISANKKIDLPFKFDANKTLILVTCHRRENFGKPFENICQALKILANNNSSVQFLYPVHLNPNIKEVAYKMLSNTANIILCEPLGYPQFVAVMKKAHLIITDSGGVQEEAPALGKPVLVLREETERPEAVQNGVARLIGNNIQHIVDEVQLLLNDQEEYKSMAKGGSPYGDGKASERIVQTLKNYFLN